MSGCEYQGTGPLLGEAAMLLSIIKLTSRQTKAFEKLIQKKWLPNTIKDY